MTTDIAKRGFWLILVLTLIAGACGGSDDQAEADAPGGDDATVPASSDAAATSVASQDDPAEDDVQDDTSDNCASGSFDAADSWPDLADKSDAAGFADVVSMVRQRTGVLSLPNPTSCQAMAPADIALAAGIVGAVDGKSFEHQEPYVRYDLFVFESRDAADQAGGRDAIKARLPGLVATGSTVQVFAVGGTLFVAESFTDGDDPEVEAILNYYGQLLAGAE